MNNRLPKLKRLNDPKQDLLDATRAIHDQLRDENESAIVDAAKAIHDKLSHDFDQRTKNLETDITLRSVKSLTDIASQQINQRSTQVENAFAEVRTDLSSKIEMLEARVESLTVQFQSLIAAYNAGTEQIKVLLQSLPIPQVNISPTPVENRIEVNPTPIENVVNVAPTPIENINNVTNAVSPTPIQVTNEVNPTPFNITNNLEQPAREKTIQYDDMGRPVHIVEKNASSEQPA